MTRRGHQDIETQIYAALFSRMRARVLDRSLSRQELLEAMGENLQQFQSLGMILEERLRKARERGKTDDGVRLSAALRALKREIERETTIVDRHCRFFLD
jgi:hypothetical protein